MADRVMSENAAKAFLAARPVVTRAADDPPQPQCPLCGGFVAEDAQYAPNVCPSCNVELPPDPAKAGKASGKSPVVAKGKPPLANGKMPVTMAMLDYTLKRVADYTKAIVGPLEKRIDALERQQASPDDVIKRLAELEAWRANSPDVSLSHRDASGKIVAEYWRHGNQVALRVGGKRVQEALAGSRAAAKLLAKFEALGDVA